MKLYFQFGESYRGFTEGFRRFWMGRSGWASTKIVLVHKRRTELAQILNARITTKQIFFSMCWIRHKRDEKIKIKINAKKERKNSEKHKISSTYESSSEWMGRKHGSNNVNNNPRIGNVAHLLLVRLSRVWGQPASMKTSTDYVSSSAK